MEILIREHGAQVSSVKMQQKAKWKQILTSKQAYFHKFEQLCSGMDYSPIIFRGSIGRIGKH